MKPVNLMPTSGTVVAAPRAASPVDGRKMAIGGGLVVVVLLIGGYVGFSKASDMKTQAQQLSAQAATDNQQVQALQQQAQEAGQTVTFTQAAQSATQSVLTALGSEIDTATIIRHIAQVTPRTVWYTQVSVTNETLGSASSDSSSGSAVSLAASAPNLETVAALKARLSTVPELTNVQVSNLTEVTPTKGAAYYTFSVAADLNGAGAGDAGSGDGSQTVGDTSGGTAPASTASTIALTPTPNTPATTAAKKPKKVAKPLTQLQQLVADTNSKAAK